MIQRARGGRKQLFCFYSQTPFCFFYIVIVEDEDAPPALAKLRLKDFYHDKESEEVLRVMYIHRRVG
jgi:hypothetical protein